MNIHNAEVSLTQASNIEIKAINWIWNGWLASGKFHVLGGMAGTGKSTIAISICATVSSGRLFPDGQRAEQGDVVIWTGEDDPQDTLVPRLKAMGADLNRVHFVGTVNNGGALRPFDPKKDMQSLQERIAKLRDIKLLVIDPIVSTIKKDANSNPDVRNDLAPTVQMAAELDFAVMGITHFSKNTLGNDPLERITGSLAFGAIPRVVWAVTKVKTEDESDKRIIVRIKNNIGKDGGGFRYSLEQTAVNGIDTSAVVWGESLSGSPEKIFREAEGMPPEIISKVEDCCEFIANLLEDKPMKSTELEHRCKTAGFSFATQRSARKKMKVRSFRVGGIGSAGEWLVSLPKMLLTDPSKNMSILGHVSQLSDENWVETEF
jgi:putative DNA primase/helicase